MRAGDEERKSDERLFSGVPPAPPSPTRFCRSFRHFRCLYVQGSHLQQPPSPNSTWGPLLLLFPLFSSEQSSLAIQMGSCAIVCVCVSSLRVRERVGE